WVNAGRVAVLGAGAVMVSQGRIGVGTLIAFFGYVGGLYEPAQALLGLYETARKAEVGLAAIYGVLDTPSAVADAPSAERPEAVAGAIDLDHVTFRYEEGAPPALVDVSLSIA